MNASAVILVRSIPPTAEELAAVGRFRITHSPVHIVRIRFGMEEYLESYDMVISSHGDLLKPYELKDRDTTFLEPAKPTRKPQAKAVAEDTPLPVRRAPKKRAPRRKKPPTPDAS